MVDPMLLLAFLAAASFLTVTPGVDTAIVLRAATVEGRRSAAFASIGITTGCLVWGGAVSLGLGAVLRASSVAYTIVKFAGAAYLLWLGARLLWNPRLSVGPLPGRAGLKMRNDAFLRGFLTNLLNPKIGVFYVTFLPQFVPASANVASYSFTLACLHVALALVWFSALILATVSLNAVLGRPGVVANLDRLTGLVFVAFAMKLALSSR